MSQQANYFRLGLFILAAIVVFIAIVLALSAGQVFKHTIVLETYFNESVQGLDTGSAVKYRGVQLGRVTNITFTFGRYEQDLPRSLRRPYVLVESEVETALIGFAAESDPERLQQAIERGLRVRIAPVGITGTAYLEIDLVEGAPPPLPIDWTPRNLYIPSAPSTYNQIVRGAQNFLVKLDRLDIETVLADAHKLLVTANTKLDQAPVDKLSADANATLRDVRAAAVQLNKLLASPEIAQATKDLAAAAARAREILASPKLDKLPEDAAATVASVREVIESPQVRNALANADRILRRLDELTAGSDADIAAALTNLRRLTENLRDLTESLKRYPGAILSDAPRPVTEGAK
ncbi:MAG TPA: MlaD family protein [Burkholderiales bacterium]|nr:MlaD family protein [Burkholderiales bacterium]